MLQTSTALLSLKKCTYANCVTFLNENDFTTKILNLQLEEMNLSVYNTPGT